MVSSEDMSLRAKDIADLFGIDPDAERDEGEEPLGTSLRGRFTDAETNSVEAVRELRERER